MASTVADIIKDALKLLGVLAAGESLGANDAADGLRSLNMLLGTWANERLHVAGTRRVTHVVSGAGPHSIGPSGTIATTRPLRIDAAGILPTGQTKEEPLRLFTDAEYQNIQSKAEFGEAATGLWVENTYPNASLWFWPVPTTTFSLVLYTWSHIAEFAATTDLVALPLGYEDALAHALAIRLAPMYGVEPSLTMISNASDAMAAIRRTNSETPRSELDPALWSGGGGSGSSDVSISTGGSSSGGLF